MMCRTIAPWASRQCRLAHQGFRKEPVCRSWGSRACLSGRAGNLLGFWSLGRGGLGCPFLFYPHPRSLPAGGLRRWGGRLACPHLTSPGNGGGIGLVCGEGVHMTLKAPSPGAGAPTSPPRGEVKGGMIMRKGSPGAAFKLIPLRFFLRRSAGR